MFDVYRDRVRRKLRDLAWPTYECERCVGQDLGQGCYCAHYDAPGAGRHVESWRAHLRRWLPQPKLLPAELTHVKEPAPPTPREQQYVALLDERAHHAPPTLGLMTAESYNRDPRHLLFTLARYKFVAKLLTGRQRVLEVGCGDAFATRLVQQALLPRGLVHAVDFDPIFIGDVQRRADLRWPLIATCHDLTAAPLKPIYDAAYALDVLEHVAPVDEARFLTNVIGSLTNDGVLIVGTPSRESQAYASAQSRAGHVNCKSGDELKSALSRYFHTVFVFSMNDEVVHTGFHPMAHYLLAVASHRRPWSRGLKLKKLGRLVRKHDHLARVTRPKAPPGASRP